MILAIDIGNTHIVIGCFDQEKIRFVERMATDKKKSELEYAISFKSVLEIYGIQSHEVKGGIISSVVPPITNVVRDAAEKIIHGEVHIVGPGLKTGLNILIDNPGQLGSDQVVDAVAALNEYPVPLMVIDMGTATTISVINEKKQYMGGMILPGIGISLNALAERTSQLPHITLEAPKRLIGKNTIECMKSGIVHGNAACMDGMIQRIEEDLGQKVTVIATGGLAKVIVPHCKRKIILDDDLLLKGLQIIYKKNKE
ncbi:MAG: type III pantothenate kinase [Lachnospiraceae bacterium]|jgi:type III pantothenate kinase